MTTTRLRNVAVVLAGGSGTRVGLAIPKQLLKVAGRTVIEHTVAGLHACDEIDEILVVMAADHVAEAERLLHGPQFAKVSRVVAGGEDRNASTRTALGALGPEECNVLFHDAVRPLVSHRVVADCVAALETHEAVDVAIPSTDTIVRVDDDDRIVEIPDRSRLRRGQTPQGFRLSVIRRAYELAATDETLRATDDCGVVLHCLPEVPIHVVRGDEQNMKVTFPIDLFIADKLFQLGSQLAAPTTPEQRAARLAGQVVVVLGGSSGIGAEIAQMARTAGAQVFTFSRSSTGTHVQDPDSVTAALDQVATQTGRIDAVVLTAAVLHKGPITAADAASVADEVAVNYLGPVHTARAAHRHLQDSEGHLLFFTSSSYTRGRADYALYSSTKAAVVNLTQALADEWSADGIKVNVINPERTRTPMRVRAFGEEPEGTLLPSEAVAATSLDVLASDLTGHVVDVLLRDAPAGAEGEADAIARAVAGLEAQAELEASVDEVAGPA